MVCAYFVSYTDVVVWLCNMEIMYVLTVLFFFHLNASFVFVRQWLTGLFLFPLLFSSLYLIPLHSGFKMHGFIGDNPTSRNGVYFVNYHVLIEILISMNGYWMDIFVGFFLPLGGSADVFCRESQGQHSSDKVRVGRNSLDIFSPVRDGERIFLPQWIAGSTQHSEYIQIFVILYFASFFKYKWIFE